MSEEESVLSLLREISTSLAAIRNQHPVTEGSCGKNLCTCECHQRPETNTEGSSHHEPSLMDVNQLNIAETSLEQGEYDSSTGSSKSPSCRDENDLLDLILVSYGEPTPRDEYTTARFVRQYGDILNTPDIKDRLSRLPPDDLRYSTFATRGNFLVNLMSKVWPPSSTPDRNSQFCLQNFDRFEEFRIRLGTGHFWIRDYDLRGNYTHWDCVNPPVIASMLNRDRDRQCDIPASPWPVDWAVRRASAPPAPWRRIISCRGFSQLVDYSAGPGRNPYFSKSVSAAASLHLHRAKQARKLTDYRSDVYKKQVCFFQIDAVSGQRPDSASPTRRMPDKYFTILLMDPITWYDELDEILETALTDEASMQTALLALVGYAVRTAATEWQKMATYFDTLLGDDLYNQKESTLLNPPKHDQLLFEDESFSRSRKYFWAIDAISAFIEKIMEALDAWERFRANEVDPFLGMTDWRERERFLLSLEAATTEVAKLDHTRQRLEKHLERTRLLRDGLFNASAVIESRAASELGRNVKLLTYVSIFYLPLSFCTSLWSTTSTFNFTSLAVVMTLVALMTYIIVFNVENLVQKAHSLYSTYRSKIVERMTADLQTKTWADRAKRFDRFEPNRRSTKPSDWYILWAAFLLLLQDLRHVFWSGLLKLPSRILRAASSGSSRGDEGA